jgi:hypothetical protein
MEITIHLISERALLHLDEAFISYTSPAVYANAVVGVERGVTVYRPYGSPDWQREHGGIANVMPEFAQKIAEVAIPFAITFNNERVGMVIHKQFVGLPVFGDEYKIQSTRDGSFMRVKGVEEAVKIVRLYLEMAGDFGE